MGNYTFGIYAAYAAIFILVFIFGSVIASFLNVIIYRLPRGISFVRGRSMCPSCGKTLAAADMIPVAGFIALRGRCRYCKARISPRYMIVEAIGGALAVATVLTYGFTPLSAAVFALMSGLIIVALIDMDTMEIPNGVVLYLLFPAAALFVLLPDTSVLSHVAGFFIVSAPLFAIASLIPGSFGGGDIKLMAVCGLGLGVGLTLLSMFIALIMGGAYGAYILASKKGGPKSHFPFGPFLALGIAAALLWGKGILSWYAGFFG